MEYDDMNDQENFDNVDETVNNNSRSRRPSGNKFEPSKALMIIGVCIVLGFAILKSIDSQAFPFMNSTTTTTSSTNVTTSTTSSSGTTGVNTATTKKSSSTKAVNVSVLNSTKTAGAASKVAAAIKVANVTVVGTGNDASENIGTTIYYAKGYESQAQEIAQDSTVLAKLTELKVNAVVVLEKMPSTLPSDWDSAKLAKLSTANVVLVIGKSI